LKKNASHTALLLFARTADEEVHYKNLLPGQPLKKQKALFQHLNIRAEHLLKATQLPYFIFNASHQQGETFGARLHAALAAVFSHGFENVMVIGNDCPALLPGDIQKAANQLLLRDVVLGPTLKGGIYLLGLTRKIFEQTDNLEEIRWQTGKVVEDLSTFFKLKETAIFLLPKYTDVNQPGDLKKVVKNKNVSHLIRKIYFGSLCIKHWLSYKSPALELTYSLISHLVFRGPPKFI